MKIRRLVACIGTAGLASGGRYAPPRLETGRIQGTVEISTALTARRPRFRIYTDVGPGSSPPLAKPNDAAAEMRNVVIYIESDRGHPFPNTTEQRRRGSIAQQDERFAPHVLAVMQGATVDFPNQDDVYHNVFSLSSARTFDLGRYPRGESRSVSFSKAGTVQVFCHIHSDMSAVVLVLDNPFFASPDAAGRFAIEELPVGDYTIVAWHERVKPITRHIHIGAGATTAIDFNIPVPPQEAAVKP